MPRWSHHSTVSFYPLCHAGGRVSERQTLLLQQGGGGEKMWDKKRAWKQLEQQQKGKKPSEDQPHSWWWHTAFTDTSQAQRYLSPAHLHLVHVLGRGVCKNSSPAVVQYSDLRWPASMLQRKKSISGHRLGWLILGSRGRTKWSGMEKGGRSKKGWENNLTKTRASPPARFLSVKASSWFSFSCTKWCFLQQDSVNGALPGFNESSVTGLI